jgi:hypothetical protein
MKNLDLKKAPRGSFKRSEWVHDTESYTTAHYGYEETIDEIEALENDDIFDEEMISARVASSQLRLAREKRVADAVFNTTTFASGNDTQAAAAVWSNASTANIFLDFDNAFVKIHAKTGIPKAALTGIVTETALRSVIRSEKVLANIKYTMAPELMTAEQQAQMIASFLGIKGLIVADSVIDTTLTGIAKGVFTGIWNPQLAMLAYISQAAPSWKSKGLGRQPRWSKFSNDFRVESYDEESTASRVVRVREQSGEKVFKTFGTIITGVMS